MEGDIYPSHNLWDKEAPSLMEGSKEQNKTVPISPGLSLSLTLAGALKLPSADGSTTYSQAPGLRGTWIIINGESEEAKKKYQHQHYG